MPSIPAATLKFLGEWLTAVVQILLAPRGFKAETADQLGKTLGFAATCGGTAFGLFFLVNEGFAKSATLVPYLIFAVLVWCVISIAYAAVIKALGGSRGAPENVALCLYLSGLFYLISMVGGILAYIGCGDSLSAFKISFIVVGSIGFMVYFPLVLNQLNGITAGRSYVLALAGVPLVLLTSYLDWHPASSSAPPVPPPALSPAPVSPAAPSASSAPSGAVLQNTVAYVPPVAPRPPPEPPPVAPIVMAPRPLPPPLFMDKILPKPAGFGLQEKKLGKTQ